MTAYRDRVDGENWTMYLGDCREILPTLTGIDAVVTDPPYGIGWGGHPASSVQWSAIYGDEKENDLAFILRLPCRVVAFGANCYPTQLPHRGRWICWDKRKEDGSCDAMLGSPFELAWCNKTSGYDQIIRVLHGGVVNADGGKRLHPTQKPVRLMSKVIVSHSEPNMLVCDPFAGSGTTGVACIETGRRFVGIEIDENYFRVACNRLRSATPCLFGRDA